MQDKRGGPPHVSFDPQEASGVSTGNCGTSSAQSGEASGGDATLGGAFDSASNTSKAQNQGGVPKKNGVAAGSGDAGGSAEGGTPMSPENKKKKKGLFSPRSKREASTSFTPKLPRARSKSSKSPRSKASQLKSAEPAVEASHVRFEKEELRGQRAPDYDPSAECDAMLVALRRSSRVVGGSDSEPQGFFAFCQDPEEQQAVQKLERNALTMALMKLCTGSLADPLFALAWLEKGGLQVLVDLLRATQDKTQRTLVLRCMASSLRHAKPLSRFFSEEQRQQLRDMTQACLRLCLEVGAPLMIPALHVLQSSCDVELQCIEREDLAALLSLLERPFQVKILALRVINSVLTRSDSSWTPWLDDRGLLVAIIDHFVNKFDEAPASSSAADDKFDPISMKDVLLQQQRLRLRHLVNLQQSDFDAENAAHQRILEDLWGNVFPDKPYEGNSGPQWKLLGFQGQDPSTDLRGAGMLALHCILFYSKQCAKEMRANCQQMAASIRSEGPYYPIAAACVKMSLMLMDEMQGLQLMIFDGGKAPFERCFCGLMKLVHAEFTRLRLTYMDFTSVLIPAVRAQLRRCLDSRSVDEFCEALGSRKESSVTAKVSTPLFTRKANTTEGGVPLVPHLVAAKQLTAEEAEAKLRALQKMGEEEPEIKSPKSRTRKLASKSPRLRAAVRSRFDRTNSMDSSSIRKHRSAAQMDPVAKQKNAVEAPVGQRAFAAESKAHAERISELEADLSSADRQNRELTAQLEALRRADPRASLLVNAMFSVEAEEAEGEHIECDARVARLQGQLLEAMEELQELRATCDYQGQELSLRSAELEATKELVLVLEHQLTQKSEALVKLDYM